MTNTDMARRAILRASDADREQIAERLRHATAEGRLRAEELEERLGAVFSARTYGELDGLVADLPASTSGLQRKTSELGWIRPAVVLALAVPVVVVVLTVLAFVVTGMLTMWGVWLVIGWWFFGHHRHHRGGWDPGARYGGGRQLAGRHGTTDHGRGGRCARSMSASGRWHEADPPPQPPRPWI
jgi:Domain of unknown function (DUF1707)